MKPRFLLLLTLLTLSVMSSVAQQHTITGTVVDADQGPLIGVTIQEKGAKSGAVTDLDGHYTIKVSKADAELTFSYVGYDTQTVHLKNRSVVNVTMRNSSVVLEQVVVVGYGSQKKVNLTGSVASVSVDKDLTSRSIANVSSALSGLVVVRPMVRTLRAVSSVGCEKSVPMCSSSVVWPTVSISVPIVNH